MVQITESYFKRLYELVVEIRKETKDGRVDLYTHSKIDFVIGYLKAVKDNEELEEIKKNREL